MESSVMRHCPVCLGRVAPDQYENHMRSHSKDEVLAALLRATPSLQPSSYLPPASSTSSTRPAANAGPLIVPQVIPGMSMVMSPVLIPQQNGPPIIVNVPSYFHPNLLTSTAGPTETSSSSVSNAISLPPTTARLEPQMIGPDPVIEPKSVSKAQVGSPRPGPSRFEESNVEPLAEDLISQRVLTVETVNDLMNAQDLLKSNDDIQIVVANDLLETNEFKQFMSHLNLPSSANNPDSLNANHVPPNTPMTTRPPSATPKDDLDYARPSTSRAVSHASSPSRNTAIASDIDELDSEEDDDICLQDLVAMETMDQVEHDNEQATFFEESDEDENNIVMQTDDQVFTLASYKESRSILDQFDTQQSHDESKVTLSLECDACGLHFPTHEGFDVHRLEFCNNVKTSKNNGLKVKKSNKSSELIAEVKSESNSMLSISDLKSEPLQPALGSISNIWKCNQCLKVFTSALQLTEHLEELRIAQFKCATCHVILDDKKMVQAHRREFHSSSSNFLTKIKIEEDSLLDSPDVKDIFPNDKGEFVCEKCDRAFTDKDLFLKHMTCHDEIKPYECLECGKKFAKAIHLRDHRKRHFEQGNYECQFCPKKFHTPIKLREHIRVHTGEAPLICNICGKGFKRHSNLSEHKRIHDENRPVKPPKELYCHCGQMFKTKRELDWHNEEVHERVPKKCQHCGEVFVHSTSLTRHIRRKHESNFVPENKKASLYSKCPLCLQTFYKTSINKHIRIKHEGQKPFTCEICKMGFVTKNNLENHQWQHKGIRSRPFKCQLCRKAYLRQNQLDAHMRAHKGIKPFVCNECGLQFSNKSNWQRHVIEHSGDRNYSCPHCNKKFSRSYYLTDHLKVHTGLKPYSCAICGKTAATRSNYNSHLRTHITREPVNSEV